MSTTPKFLKDEAGFCYVYTEHLAALEHLTPHDGDIDAHGMAVDEKPKAKSKKPDAE